MNPIKAKRPRTKIVNRTKWSNVFLRRMLKWCMKATGCQRMRSATFGNKSYGSWNGRAWPGQIIVRIGPDRCFPTGEHHYPDRPNGPRYIIADRIEALVMVTLHETIHVRDFRKGIKISENDTEFRMIGRLNEFRAQRETLLAAWNAPVKERPKAPEKSRAEKTLEKNLNALSKWEAKLKLAKTKLAKYRAAVRAGQRYAAMKAGKGTA